MFSHHKNSSQYGGGFFIANFYPPYKFMKEGDKLCIELIGVRSVE